MGIDSSQDLSLKTTPDISPDDEVMSLGKLCNSGSEYLVHLVLTLCVCDFVCLSRDTVRMKDVSDVHPSSHYHLDSLFLRILQRSCG